MQKMINGVLRFKRRQLTLNVFMEARVDELSALFETLYDFFRPSAKNGERIFNLLFVNKASLDRKMVEIAKIILELGGELILKVVDQAQKVVCEIVTYSRFFQRGLVRVMHYLSDGAHGLTQLHVA